MVRVGWTWGSLGSAVLALLKNYGWQHVALAYIEIVVFVVVVIVIIIVSVNVVVCARRHDDLQYAEQLSKHDNQLDSGQHLALG
jgi:hypothetical protein